MAPTDRDQAPAAQTTVSVTIRPLLVTTAVMVSRQVSMPRTSQSRSTVAPRRRAPAAYPWTTDSGVQCPSSGEKAAASRPSVEISGESRRASAGSTIRLGTPRSFWSWTPASNWATSSGVVRRKR